MRDIMRKYLEAIGGQALALIAFTIFRFVYYLFFETVFSATPAKYFTETKVISDEGEALKFSAVLGRTAARFVPFESLSFIFNYAGWHDRWSGTAVVKEHRTGVPAKKYLYIFPILLLSGLVWIGGINLYALYSRHSRVSNELSRLGDKLDNLSSNDIIELYSSTNYNHVIYLKVESKGSKSQTFSIVSLDNSFEYDQTTETIEDFYVRNRSSWLTIEMNLDSLREGLITREISFGLGGETGPEVSEGVTVKGLQEKFIIKSIEPYFQPNLKLESVTTNERNINFYLKTIAWNGIIEKISTLKGGLYFDDKLPIEVKRNSYNPVTLTATSKEVIEEYEFEITVRDSLNNVQYYRMIGDAMIPKSTEIILKR